MKPSYARTCCWLRLSLLSVVFILHAATLLANENEQAPQAAKELPPAAERKVDFASEIAPIFAQRCFACHGEDEQEGRLRLDAKAIVERGGLSGPLLIAGKSGESLLVQRLAGRGDAVQMPPEEEPLSDEQIGLVRAWIDQGAVWPRGFGSEVKELDRHWAYKQPVKLALPNVKHSNWAKNAIDHFVLAKLESLGQQPAPEAEKAQLLRRVSLDLIGLPPTLDELKEFLADDSPAAYEQTVDRLLASERYGERWARHWLDLVRYADSNGYQADQIRELWPYRDWVVKAMNDDMPLDQFTLEQLAGDLLPNSTTAQKIATGMHRATTCNVEAGVDPEENRVNQVIDRVNVTSTVWLGTTMECVQCHNHKYDPFAQRDYYSLFAFFNNTPLEVKLESGVQFELAGPAMELPLSPEQLAERVELQKQRDAMQAEIASRTKSPAKPAPDANECVDDGKSADAEGETAEEKPLKDLKASLAAMNEQLKAIKPTSTLVMIEMNQPRETHIFKRGNFLTPGAAVSADTPRELHPFASELPRNRVGLASWLVCQENPLVGRVFVNRWWAEMFGAGLVETLEDFGSQAEPAVYPELLDWLAVEFAENGWSMKKLQKMIVMSATYRQSSAITPEAMETDPYNKLLARGPRFRLPAETIRDNALAISGLLTHKLGGPPVFPPQPEGIWRHVGRNAPKYAVSKDEDRYRRGLYVVWRRSAPYPSFTTFDAPDRAAACIKRPRTNTPLQALTLMNDPAYLEIAGALAERFAMEASELSIKDRIIAGFKRAVARAPNEAELLELEQIYEQQLTRYQGDIAAAKKLLGAAAFPPDESAIAERAAWFYVATVLLNLDETITKN
jgi:mono/diheme cytochrome c family protein